MLQTAMTNEDAHVQNFEMLKIARNVLSFDLQSDFEHFNISQAHALTRAFIDLKLTGRIFTLIMINMFEK